MLKEISVAFAFIAFASSAPDGFNKRKFQATLEEPDDNPPPNPTITPPPPTHPRDSPDWIQPPGPADEKSREFWQLSGQQILHETLKREMNKKVAKNLIILVADGMSIPTQMATRMFMGGEEKVLSFEKFPYVGLSKVRTMMMTTEGGKSFPFEYCLGKLFIRRHIA